MSFSAAVTGKKSKPERKIDAQFKKRRFRGGCGRSGISKRNAYCGRERNRVYRDNIFAVEKRSIP